jgi:hypothetical protein
MHTRKILDSQHRALANNKLSMWTVFDHPKDFPHSFVARRFEVNGTGVIATDDIVQGDLNILRESFLKAGMYCLTRNDDDDEKIVETWL